ncbi:MAG: imidazole glycerol phosphate synthase subunit HisH [Candidatus Sumerlaeia bacterium]
MIVIVDYGMGNLRSVSKAFEAVGVPVRVTRDKAEVQAADRLIVPGQGAFGDAVKELHACGLWDSVLEHLASGKPFFGICLGLQLLMEGSEEAPGVEGFGHFRGRCRLLRVSGKVPHMGWNQLRYRRPDCPLFAGLDDPPFFYFAHSYYADPQEPDCIAATTDYEVEFPVVLWRGNVVAVQFHPEKSQQAGLRVIRNFLEWNGR